LAASFFKKITLFLANVDDVLILNPDVSDGENYR